MGNLLDKGRSEVFMNIISIILTVFIIVSFVGTLIYLIFFKDFKHKDSKHDRIMDAHSTNSSSPANTVFDFFESNNIEPQFLGTKQGDKNV